MPEKAWVIPGVASVPHRHARRLQPLGIGETFVVQHVASSGDDDRRRYPGNAPAM